MPTEASKHDEQEPRGGTSAAAVAVVPERAGGLVRIQTMDFRGLRPIGAAPPKARQGVSVRNRTHKIRPRRQVPGRSEYSRTNRGFSDRMRAADDPAAESGAGGRWRRPDGQAAGEGRDGRHRAGHGGRHSGGVGPGGGRRARLCGGHCTVCTKLHVKPRPIDTGCRSI
jgi:hypothetical protein